jgi:hypothetical protein
VGLLFGELAALVVVVGLALYLFLVFLMHAEEKESLVVGGLVIYFNASIAFPIVVAWIAMNRIRGAGAPH